MKKILFILILLLLNTSSVFADEIQLEFDDNFPKQTLNILQPSNFKTTSVDKTRIAISETPALPLETSTPVQTHTKLFNGISQTAHNLYNLQIENTDSPSALFKDQLTKRFDKGPIESFHTWGVIQANSDTVIPESGDGNTRFNVGLINVLFDAKTRDGKDDFRLMLDMTHQHNRPFMQQFVQDAYYETHRIPHHSILIGNSRPGVGYEGAQSPYTLPFINL